ncbi:MAG: histidine kinase [Bacteroidales bacterium]|nr:histidine kinase [Bacteroidales bacterium]
MKATKHIFLIFLLLAGLQTAGNPAVSPDRLNIKLPARSGEQDTARINKLIKEGFRYLSAKPVMRNELKASIDTALLICKKQKIDTPPDLHLLSAEYYFLTYDLGNAQEEAKIALDKSVELNEPEITVRALIFMGRYYYQTGFFKESIESYEKAVSAAKKQGIKGYIPRIYINIAQVYDAIGDLSGHRSSFQQVIDYGKAEKDSARIAFGYYRLGTSFCGDSIGSPKRNFNKADSLLKKGLDIAVLTNDTVNIALNLANLGWNYYLEKKYDLAISSYELALKYSIPAGEYASSSNILGNLGTIYRDLKKYQSALKYYQEAIKYGIKSNSLYDLQWIYLDMSNLFLRNADTANAYLSYVQYKKYYDAFVTNQNIQGLTNARLRYEVDNHNKELELLSLRLKNNRLLNYAFTGFFVLTFAIGYLLFRGSKLKAKRSLSEMNRRISELTQANLRQQMNPHFIFNTLNSIQYYMYQHDKLATNNYLTKFSNLMRRVLENSQHTSVSLQDELDALKLYLELESLRFRDRFEYEIKVDEEIDTLMYKVPTMLIQPYVENSICHGLMPKTEKGFVKICIKLKEDYLNCIIEDNGIGRDAARERNSEKKKNHNSLGTQITASRLDLVNELYGTSMKTITTDLKGQDGEPLGTRVEIHIPVMT